MQTPEKLQRSYQSCLDWIQNPTNPLYTRSSRISSAQTTSQRCTSRVLKPCVAEDPKLYRRRRKLHSRCFGSQTCTISLTLSLHNIHLCASGPWHESLTYSCFRGLNLTGLPHPLAAHRLFQSVCWRQGHWSPELLTAAVVVSPEPPQGPWRRSP